ncbi:MAG: alkaline phosphatase family protein [Thermoplasmata archaeon]
MKMAVVGLDSADWTLLDRWLHYLPHIASVRREGVSGPLTSCKPPVTIPAWKCYSTGKNPGKLGVFWFAYPDFSQRTLQLNLPGGLRGELWDFIANSIVVNTPGTFPARDIDGIMIAGHPCPDDQPFVTPSWAIQELGDYRVNSRVYAGDPAFPEEAMSLIRSRFEAFHRYASRFDFGQVTVFYIDELHHFHGSDSVVLDAWRLIDEEIGRVMEVADNVALVSDHGSGPLREFVNVVPSLREMGAFRSRRSSGRTWSSLIRRALQTAPPTYRNMGERFLPTKFTDAIRSHLGPMDGLLPSPEQFQARVDWSSFILPLNQGLIYRNPNPRHTRVSLRDVEDVLKKIPGVDRVWRKEEIYDGPLLASAPDIWIEGEPGKEITARFDEDWETKRPERGEDWIVNHRADGIFGFLGKDVEPADVGPALIYDMCPTILSFFDIPPPSTVDGTALRIVGDVSGGDSRGGPDTRAAS